MDEFTRYEEEIHTCHRIIAEREQDIDRLRAERDALAAQSHRQNCTIATLAAENAHMAEEITARTLDSDETVEKYNRIVSDAAATIAALRAALEAVVEAGRMSDQSRALYCVEIARAALAKAQP